MNSTSRCSSTCPSRCAIHYGYRAWTFPSQRALRDRLMSRGKNCLPTVSRQFLTHNYPRPNCLLKCLPNCISPTREDVLSSFKIDPAVRVIVRQVRDKNCLAVIFAPRHQSVSSGPLGALLIKAVCGRLIFYHYWCWRAGGAAPVKTSTGNNFPRKYQRIPRNYYQYWC